MQLALTDKQYERTLTTRPQANRIVRYIPETDMRNGHYGLFKVARKAGLDVRTIDPGSFVVFTNRNLDKMKVFGGGGMLVSYISLPRGHRINVNVIRELPRFFKGGSFDYTAAVGRTITRSLTTR